MMKVGIPPCKEPVPTSSGGQGDLGEIKNRDCCILACFP